MYFLTWKVKLGEGTRQPLCFYCLRAYVEQPPIVLEERHFSSLFPEINLDLIPEAPKTVTLSVEAQINLIPTSKEEDSDASKNHFPDR